MERRPSKLGPGVNMPQSGGWAYGKRFHRAVAQAITPALSACHLSETESFHLCRRV